MKGLRAIDSLGREAEEDWECESLTDLVHGDIRRPLTPASRESPVKQLQFNTPQITGIKTNKYS